MLARPGWSERARLGLAWLGDGRMVEILVLYYFSIIFDTIHYHHIH